jgi:N-acetylglucosaminyldiphosphoundecaprenol N-acetyl-beta-D-mannosaminyltransferase
MQESMQKSGCTVLGVRCFVGDLDGAAEEVIERALSGRGGYACLANTHVLVTARGDSRLRAALNSAWAVFPDGAPVAWLQRRSRYQSSRVAGPDLMLKVLDRGREVGVRHFLFGSTTDVLTNLEANLTARFDGVRIAGQFAPPPADEASRDALQAVRTSHPDIVWVALGAPKQELWAAQHATALAPALIIGVGAAFDFHAGRVPRAPLWMQRMGCEWLHRLVHEPRRLGWRYAWTNARLALVVLRGNAVKP